MALFICKLNNVVVNKHTVCREGETEVFVVFLLNASCVGDNSLYNVKVHQRFSAEEIDLEVNPAARVLDKKVDSPLAHFKAHQSAFAVVFSLTCKAVFAVEVAGVSDMQTKRLNNRVAFFKVKGKVFILILGKEFAVLLKLLNVVNAITNFLLGNLGIVPVLVEHCGDNLGFIRVFIHFYNIVSELVNKVNAAAVYVEHDVVAVKFVLMYHMNLPLYVKGKPLPIIE